MDCEDLLPTIQQNIETPSSYISPKKSRWSAEKIRHPANNRCTSKPTFAASLPSKSTNKQGPTSLYASIYIHCRLERAKEFNKRHPTELYFTTQTHTHAVHRPPSVFFFFFPIYGFLHLVFTPISAWLIFGRGGKGLCSFCQAKPKKKKKSLTIQNSLSVQVRPGLVALTSNK